MYTLESFSLSVLLHLCYASVRPSWCGRKELALERVLGRLLERLGRAPHSVLRLLNRVPVVEGNTRVAVDIRAVERRLHSNQVVGHLSINRVTTRDVVDIRDVAVHLHSFLLAGRLSLNRVAIRAVVDTRAVAAHLHSILVLGHHLGLNRMTTRDVVVRVPEGECRSHTVAGMWEVVLDQVFLQVHLDQFPSCTKPQMSNIKPLWWQHHHHRELARPRSLGRPR